jgi:hypothetical protein
LSIFQRLFGRRIPAIELDHPVFGHLVFSTHDGWQNKHFTLWGVPDVDLLLDAGVTGPTAEQEAAFTRFRDAKETLLPRCLNAVMQMRHEMGRIGEVVGSDPSGFKITGLTVPPLDDSRAGRLWTLWLDCDGDDHFWYGIQTEDDWRTILPFADD